ncbi:MAG: hypothetical protein Q7T55_07940 [Solirubrobacteraceae bacterium]|nr:hypothetical protein [Solirubrobacteraceae bacterium]
MSGSRSRSALVALGVSLALGSALIGCGGDASTGSGDGQGSTTTDEKVVLATPKAATVAERAAKKRAAQRKRRALAAKRTQARDQRRGQALLQGLIDAGTRDTWSVMSVTAKGGDVAVSTDLPPGSGGFMGACEALNAAEPWIDTVAVRGTDGGAHATWARGDAACQAG